MSRKYWIIFLGLGALISPGALFIIFGKDRFIRLLFKYGPLSALIFIAFLALCLIVFLIRRHLKKLKKKREEESRIDLRDLFAND